MDLVAHARRPHTCVAVECTTGGIDGAKLTKFVKRVAEINRMVGGVHVVPLLVTSTSLDR